MTTKDEPDINDNNGKVPPGDTRAYLVYCNEKDGVCCSQLICGNHVSQFQIHRPYIDAVKKLITCLKEQIDKGIGDIKKLKEQLKDAKKALGDTETAHEFIVNQEALIRTDIDS